LLGVSIILVNYNGKAFLKDCLESIKASDASQEEIIIIDNASSDGSCSYIKKEFPYVKLLQQDKNCGFALANNIAAEAALGEYLIFLNNDTVVTPNWLRPLLEMITSDPNIGVVGSKLFFFHQPDLINSVGANIVFNGGGYDIGFMDVDSDKHNTPSPRGAICAAAMMVRKKEFLAFGGFDPIYFMYFEDIDLCWRYWLLGYKVLYIPKSIVYHRFGGVAGSDKHTPIRIFYGTRNSIFNIIKNFELANMPLGLAFNIIYHTGKLLLFLVCLRPKRAWTILMAYWSLVKHIKEIIKKRRNVQRMRKVSDEYLFKNSLVVPLSVVVKEYLRLKGK